ncbi:hypothetical protein RN001_005870 [Aquatica leii]|uniref:DUF4806 domain-containing protein n=1 Tax=Aquatica leii TaxID=1421715 RepID=A0AAN7PHM4_9COLE|nr:hypothetical protein RN001_005870 [Aquatica leii]
MKLEDSSEKHFLVNLQPDIQKMPYDIKEYDNEGRNYYTSHFPQVPGSKPDKYTSTQIQTNIEDKPIVQYSVVHFTDEGNVSVVPTSWILEMENGDNDKYECWWPKKNVRKAIQLASRPSTHWDLFAVDVLGAYVIPLDFSNEESETESDCLEVENIVEELLVEDDLINRPKSVEEYLMQGNTESQGNSADINIQQKECHIVPFNSTKKSIVSTEENTSASIHQTLLSINAKLTEIHRKQCEMDQVLQIFSERLLNVEVKLPATMHSALNNTGNDLLPKKQFSTVEELQEFENNFSEETNKQLICHLKLCGGRDFKDAIKRHLKLFFSNSLATICSWTGQKHHYKVKDMKIMRVIKEAVSSSFNFLKRKPLSLLSRKYLKKLAREQSKDLLASASSSHHEAANDTNSILLPVINSIESDNDLPTVSIPFNNLNTFTTSVSSNTLTTNISQNYSTENDKKFIADLTYFALETHLSRNHFNNLLELLRKYDKLDSNNAVKDCRTLLKSDYNKDSIVTMGAGEYFHFGISSENENSAISLQPGTSTDTNIVHHEAIPQTDLPGESQHATETFILKSKNVTWKKNNQKINDAAKTFTEESSQVIRKVLQEESSDDENIEIPTQDSSSDDDNYLEKIIEEANIEMETEREIDNTSILEGDFVLVELKGKKSARK